MTTVIDAEQALLKLIVFCFSFRKVATMPSTLGSTCSRIILASAAAFVLPTAALAAPAPGIDTQLSPVTRSVLLVTPPAPTAQTSVSVIPRSVVSPATSYDHDNGGFHNHVHLLTVQAPGAFGEGKFSV